jgi:hypothetical protein
VPENDNETRSEPGSRKFNASYTRRRDDIPSDANHEQITEVLIKDDLSRHTRVGATEHDGEGVLTLDEFVTPSEPQGRGGRSIGREAAVAFAESLQCVTRGEHGVFWVA